MNRRPTFPIPNRIIVARRQERARARAEARWMRIVAIRERRARNMLLVNVEILREFVNDRVRRTAALVEEMRR